VRRFRGDAIQFDDSEARTSLEVVERTHAHVVAAEIEPFEAFRHIVERALEFWGQDAPAVQEQCAATVSPQITK
jgi:hypothetical protein